MPHIGQPPGAKDHEHDDQNDDQVEWLKRAHLADGGGAGVRRWRGLPLRPAKSASRWVLPKDVLGVGVRVLAGGAWLH